MKEKKIVDLIAVGGTSVIAGKTGSGKTLLATYLADIASRNGIPVFSNVPMDIKGVTLMEDAFIPKILHNDHQRNFLVIIDEYATVSLEKEQKERLAAHLVQARKHWGGHWVFIAQDYRFFDLEIRRLALYVWEVSRVMGMHKVKVMEQVIYERLYAVGGADWDARKLRKNVWLKLRVPKRYYNYYDSFGFVDVSCFGDKSTTYTAFAKLTTEARSEMERYCQSIDSANP